VVDAGAKQRRGGGRVEARRNAQDEGFIDYDAGGITAERAAAENLVFTIVGPDGTPVRQYCSWPARAIRAGATRIDHAAHAGKVAFLEFCDVVADAGDATDNFVGRGRTDR